MDLKTLTTFIRVAELGSFTKAGQALGCSQSTISFQIRQLEDELGFPLFERINRTVVLTDKGREVLAYAHQIGKMTAELKHTLQTDGTRSVRVRLAIADSLCNSLLEDNFQDFLEHNPGTSLKIVSGGTEEMFRLLDHNEVDASLTLESHIYNTEYVIVREEQVASHFVVSSASSLAEKKEISLDELVKQPFILTEKGMSYRRLLDEQLAQRSLEIIPVLEIGNPHLICDVVRKGAGVSFLPDFVTEKARRTGALVYLDIPEIQVTIWKQLLHHRDKWISPQIDSVLKFCMEKEFQK